MIPCVPDASVGVKWQLPEDRSDEARALLRRAQRGDAEFHVPGHFPLEVANVFWKRFTKGEMEPMNALSALDRALAFPLTVHPTGALLPRALEVALACRRTVYDALYVALAERIDGILVTDDVRLLNGLEHTRWRRYVRLLTDSEALF